MVTQLIILKLNNNRNKIKSQDQLNQVFFINLIEIEYKFIGEKEDTTYKGEVIKGTKIKHGLGEVTYKE